MFKKAYFFFVAILCGSQALFSAAPTITTITPSSGPVTGYGTVVIQGSNFTDIAQVNFGGVLIPRNGVASGPYAGLFLVLTWLLAVSMRSISLFLQVWLEQHRLS
jgi:hypothetical protein